ncbi:MAG: L,D-transpeptidase family protein [Lachnospiraceae bacterium]|nr:L,D-transpeptidase family protein [Lachnospiraceae bacterium]
MKNKMKNIILALAVASLTVLCSFAAFADSYPDVYVPNYAPGETGWAERFDGWHYLDHGRSLTGWFMAGDKWYYSDFNGRMLTGWQEINGVQYYLAEVTTDAWPKGSCYISTMTPDGNWVDENGAKTGKPNPYGHTCVEVNITTQTVYVYQGDALFLVSPCVTGYKDVHNTTAGDFYIKGKETNTYLTGPTWRSFVNFWMPFNGGMGLHDAGWRGTSHENFGGQIYVHDGSHGCVNMPYDMAEKLYSIAYVGMPVHVHY